MAASRRCPVQETYPTLSHGHLGRATRGALHRAPNDIVVPKRRYSAFFGTDLDLHLRERHIATVLVIGVVTNICVRSTVHDAFFLGYEVVVPVECVAATSPQAQATSLYDMATHYGTVAPLDQVLSLLPTP
jgi:ureidoacrylate peracid hydrolase